MNSFKNLILGFIANTAALLRELVETSMDRWREATPLQKKIFPMIPLVLIALIYFSTRPTPPPTRDEFFARNPHLTPATPAFKPSLLAERSDDQFREGDYALKSGRKYVIDFSMSQDFKQKTETIFDLQTSGKMVIYPVEMKGGKLSFIAEYQTQAFKSKIALKPRIQEQLGMNPNSKSLDHFLYLTVDPRGELLSASSSLKQSDPVAVGVKVQLANAIFRRLPKLEPGQETIHYRDDKGVVYPIQYNVEKKGSSLIIKSRIENSRVMGSMAVKTATKSESTTVPVLHLSQLEESETQWDVSNSLPTFQNSTARMLILFENVPISSTGGGFRFSWVSSDKDDFLAKNSLSYKKFPYFMNVKDILAQSVDKAQQKQAGKKVPPGGSTLNNFNRLGKANSNMTEDERRILFDDLTNDLQENPRLVDRYLQTAKSGLGGSAQTDMMLGAMGALGTDEAQSAMIDVYKDENAIESEKKKVLMELAIPTSALSADTKKFLREEVTRENIVQDDLSRTALFALGSSISMDGDPNTVSFLQNEWRKSEGGVFSNNDIADVTRKSVVLQAMGNSKSNVFTSEALEALNSDNATLRSAAVDSLRFVPDSQTRSILEGTLQSDRSNEVRATAARSMLHQPSDERTNNTLISCGNGDSDDGVRLECYRSLSIRIENPAVRQYLESKASGESNPMVKEALESMVSLKSNSESD